MSVSFLLPIDPLSDQFHVGIVLVVAHAIGDDGGHQRFDGAQHGHRHRGAEQAVNQVGMKCRYLKVGPATRNPAEAASNGFDWQLEQDHCDRACDHRHNGPGNSVRQCTAYQQCHQGSNAENRRCV